MFHYVRGSKVTPRLLLACCLLLPLVAAAQREEDEDAPKSWVEIEVKLPPFPKPENLIPFDVSAASSSRFYVDAGSISIGSDGVVRYTLVIKGSGGGENISYEGMRCETREQKYYGFGRRDGTWVNARTSEWLRIEYQHINRQHGVLYAEYFCPDRRKPVKSPQDAINRFKYGVPPGGGT